MEETYLQLRSITFLLLLSFFLSANASIEEVINRSEGLQTYIIHVSPNPAAISTPHECKRWHRSFLPDGTARGNEPDRLIYSYNNVASGFAARLTEKELAEMKRRPGFLHATPDRMIALHTTRTPDFLGLRRAAPGFWRDSNFGRGIIVGVLDSGISPDHVSFADNGMPAPPARWKGVCAFNASDCNNKLIGARNFVHGSQVMRGEDVVPQGPYDDDGHGTHTAGTATGVFVEGANTYGEAVGTAAGMAPSAHLAVYKVCGKEGCANSDILAGLDSAISDGVDVVSLSLGPDDGSSPAFYDDCIAIGTFAAMEKGIFVSCSAGNEGPGAATLGNVAPWMLTVGASTLDRAVRTTATLGNGAVYNGESLFQPANSPPTGWFTLVYPGAVGGPEAMICNQSSLNSINVRGMVVLCEAGGLTVEDKGAVVKSAGGVGMIVANRATQGSITSAVSNVLPSSTVSYADGLAIKSYIRSSFTTPTASIAFKGTLIGVTPSPAVAGFSSRGPSQVDPNILKPDIVGPGVAILAASRSSVGGAPAKSSFQMMSGTSMATPHLSGIAALLKAAHPDWSPAAIKSAIMTSAYSIVNAGNPITDQTMGPANLFAVGAGHVNPSGANNPGMIYDIGYYQYIAYLCGLGYKDDQVSAIARRVTTCSTFTPISGAGLNYPSFMVSLSAANGYTVRVPRTVTNVGAPRSAYTVRVSPPSGVSVTVKPEQLSFSEAKEKLRYYVTFTAVRRTQLHSEGHLTWVSSDQRIAVNSPIMVAIKNEEGLLESY